MTQPSSDIKLLGDDKSLDVPWPNVPLPDLLSLIVDNRGRTAPVVSSGIPLIATDCIKEDALYPVRQNLRYVSKETYETWFRGHPEPGDVILVNKGTPGRVCQVSAPVDFCIAQDMVSLRPKPGVVDSDYLLAALRSSDFKEQVEGLHVGTMIPHLKKTDFPHLKIPLPPLPIQKAIGRIYCDLSRKIELNRRMNRTLEELAAALFRSWFVDFDPVVAKAAGRQPVHLRPELAALFPATFQDSPLGSIPHGWHIGTVDELMEVTMGQSPPSSSYNVIGEGVPFFQGCTDFGFRFPTNRVFCTAPTRYAKKGDILLSVRAPVGDTNIALEDCSIGRGLAALRGRNGERSFPFYALRSQTDEFASFEGEGTLFGAINGPALRGLRLILPPAPVMEAFEKCAVPWDVTIEHNVRESRTLAALRDTLLPKLLSGELRVEQVEKELVSHG
jgi:type I restriction enzyme S subunit